MSDTKKTGWQRTNWQSAKSFQVERDKRGKTIVVTRVTRKELAQSIASQVQGRVVPVRFVPA